MRLKLAVVLIGILLAVTGQAKADGPYPGGVKERYDIPAPIPDGGYIAVPAGVPVPEGFTYYMRADVAWTFQSDRTYSETGRIYGQEGGQFTSAGGPFTSSAFGSNLSSDGVFMGGFGFGAYFTPRFRGDLTLDIGGQQSMTATGSYSYTNTAGPNTVNGTVDDNVKMYSVVGLANIYYDLLPRGWFTPYIGAGAGFVYNDATRTYTNTEVVQTVGLPTHIVSGTSHETGTTFAAALMAGSSFALGPTWVLDVNYRALYLGGMDITTPTNSTLGDISKASLGNAWEHQVRVGVRVNIW